MPDNTKIIYLHGLGSNGSSSTAKSLQELGLNVISPSYEPEHYEDSIQLLLELISTESPAVIVGTSMGAYYSLKLSELTGIRCVAVNPCFEPEKHLEKYLHSPAVNYVTNEPIDFNQNMLEAFVPLALERTTTTNIVIGENDDVIPAAYQKAFCERAGWTYSTTDWGHRVGNPALLSEFVTNKYSHLHPDRRETAKRHSISKA